MRVFRADSPMGGLSAPKKLRGGGRRLDGYFTKPGVFPYVDHETGQTVMEYRPSSEVFSKTSMDSWKGVPITDGHPHELVGDDGAAWEQHAVGHLGDDVRIHDGKLAASHVIQRKDAVAKIDSREMCELSGGYWCDIDDTPGVTSGDPYVPDGIRFHRVQRNIEGNHTAGLARGDARLGRDIALRLDARGHAMPPLAVGVSYPALKARDFVRSFQTGEKVRVFRADAKETTPMTTKFDGKDYDLEDEADRKILKRDLESFEARLATERADAKTVTAERDETKGRLDAAEKKLAEAVDPTRIAEAVKARHALESEAREVCSDKARLDASDEDLRKAIRDGKVAAIQADSPEDKLEGRSDDYINGRYAGIRRDQRASEDALGALRIDAFNASQSGGGLDAGAILRAADQRFREDTAKLGTRTE